MEILNYNSLDVQKYNINNVIDNILYKNINYDENDKYIYYLLQNLELNKREENKEDTIYIKYEKKLKYKNIILPSIKNSKILIIYEKESKKHKLISAKEELNVKILNYLINYIKKLKYILGILNNLVINLLGLTELLSICIIFNNSFNSIVKVLSPISLSIILSLKYLLRHIICIKLFIAQVAPKFFKPCIIIYTTLL